MMPSRSRIIADNSRWFLSPSGENLTDVTNEKISGLFFDVLKDLESRLNFTTRLLFRRDRLFGYNVNETWTGMIGNAVRKESDFIAASMTISTKRLKVLDFLHPIGSETLAAYIPSKNFKRKEWLSFFYPLKSDVWFYLLLNSFILLLGFKVLQSYYQYNQRLVDQDIFKKLYRTVGDWWMLFASYFGRIPKDQVNQEEHATRLLLLIAFLTGNIVFMSYRASLTAELSARRRSLPFETLEELIQSDFRYYRSQKFFSPAIFFLGSHPCFPFGSGSQTLIAIQITILCGTGSTRRK